MKLEKIAQPDLKFVYLTFGTDDNEVIGIKNWAAGQNDISFMQFNGTGFKVKQKFENNDGRTVDGMALFENDLLVFESGDNGYRGLIQNYEKENGVWRKTGHIPTLNFIENPSIQGGIIAGSEIHDRHGCLLSLYDLNYAIKNIFTQRINDGIGELTWMPITNHLVLAPDKLSEYAYDSKNISLTDVSKDTAQYINKILRDSNSKIKGNSHIKSLATTKYNELILGILSYTDIPFSSSKNHDCYVALTTPLDKGMLDINGEPQKIDFFHKLTISPSDKYLLTHVSDGEINIYSIKK